MNCKPGDLAIVTRGRNAGCIVSVLRPFNPSEPISGRLWRVVGDRNLPGWVVEAKGRPLSFSTVGRVRMETRVGAMPDKILRPLRDDDPAIDEKTEQPIEEVV